MRLLEQTDTVLLGPGALKFGKRKSATPGLQLIKKDWGGAGASDDEAAVAGNDGPSPEGAAAAAPEDGRDLEGKEV
jgi:hypothetical protein